MESLRTCRGGSTPARSRPAAARTVRFRFNRGGDRHLNRAMPDITLTRWRVCPRTHAYVARRRAQGKSDNDIARELYRALEAPSAA